MFVFLVPIIALLAPPRVAVHPSQSDVERGRLVYAAQGCARCHAQHTRPDTLHRPQGPDLSQVGARRSALWLKMHLYNPRQVSGASTMPSYALLFRDRRGNDLVAYLASLRSPETPHPAAAVQQWHLSADILASSNPAEGPQLYNRFCATCHNANGRTRLKWQSHFIESPAVLTAGPAPSASSASPPPARIDHFAQIIKFGIPSSDMAGHERMPDKDIASLSSWLAQNTAQPSQPRPPDSSPADQH